MSLVVCNSGPLIALAGVGGLDCLRSLFGTVLVCQEVRQEVEAGGFKKHGGSIFEEHAWLQVSERPSLQDPLLSAVLDAGEAATISLARQNGAALVLIDEAKGRKIAREIYHLQVIGTGRILVEAKRVGLIRAVRPLLDQMRANGYWLANRIVDEILRQADE